MYLILPYLSRMIRSSRSTKPNKVIESIQHASPLTLFKLSHRRDYVALHMPLYSGSVHKVAEVALSDSVSFQFLSPSSSRKLQASRFVEGFRLDHVLEVQEVRVWFEDPESNAELAFSLS